MKLPAPLRGFFQKRKAQLMQDTAYAAHAVYVETLPPTSPHILCGDARCPICGEPAKPVKAAK